MFFFSFQLARYFSCFHFFRQTSGCRKTLWLPGQSNRILSKPAPRTSPGLKFPGKTPLLLHRVQKNCLAVQQICFRKKLLVQSVVLAISVENGSFCLKLHSLCWKRASSQFKMPMYFASALWFLRFLWAPVDEKNRSPAAILFHTLEKTRKFRGIWRISYVTFSIDASCLIRNWNLQNVQEDVVFT